MASPLDVVWSPRSPCHGAHFEHAQSARRGSALCMRRRSGPKCIEMAKWVEPARLGTELARLSTELALWSTELARLSTESARLVIESARLGTEPALVT